MKTEKGCTGYIKSQQLLRTIRTAAMFAVVFVIFRIGLKLNEGDRRNIYSIIAAVGCIPAAMSAVSMIMVWMRRPVASAFEQEVRARAGDATVLFELYVTSYEVSLYLHAACLRDDHIAAYAPEAKSEGSIALFTRNLKKAIQQAGYEADIRVTADQDTFFGMLGEFAGKETEDPEFQEILTNVLLSQAL